MNLRSCLFGHIKNFTPLKNLFPFLFLIFCFFSFSGNLPAQSLDIPTRHSGISFGNSKVFNGLRINFRDNQVERINGINITLWSAKENKNAVVNGLSLGLVAPEAAYLKGFSIGVLGVAAEKDLSGIQVGLLGAGAGGNVSGITIGGLGAGSGGDISGLVIGGLGAGSGGSLKGAILAGLGGGCNGDLTGIAFGGLGFGAQGNIRGLAVGLLGVGGGQDITGITFGGLGAGASGNMTGLNIGGIGIGAGKDLSGITFGGVGAGCGNELKGVTICGIGAGAPTIKGVTLAGIAVGGDRISGASLALGMIKIQPDGVLKGFAASAYNQIKGRQTGMSLGIFNYAWQLNGIQIGLINYVRDNPKYLKVLPLFNAHFK